MYEFPRLAEYVDEQGIPDDELKPIIIDRFYEMKNRKNHATIEVINAIEKARNSVIGVLTNEAIFAYFVPLQMLLNMRQLIIEAANTFESSSSLKKMLL